MTQLSIAGVAYRTIAGEAPVAQIALATRRGETNPIVRNFVARAVLIGQLLVRPDQAALRRP